MAALAGLRIDNCVVEIDAGECPGCDGSSRAFVEALDRAGIVEQDRMRQAPGARRVGQHPRGRRRAGGPTPASGALTLAYHLDYGRGCADPRPELLRGTVSRDLPRPSSRPAAPSCSETEAECASRRRDRRADDRGRPLDLRPRRRRSATRCAIHDECARHKVLDLVGDLALLGCRPSRVRRRPSLGPPDQPCPGAPAARADRRAEPAAASRPHAQERRRCSTSRAS